MEGWSEEDRLATEVGVAGEEQQNSSTARRMLEVSGDTEEDDGDLAVAALVSERATGSPAFSRGEVRRRGLTKIRALRRSGVDRRAGLRATEVEGTGFRGVQGEGLRPLVLGAMVERGGRRWRWWTTVRVI